MPKARLPNALHAMPETQTNANNANIRIMLGFGVSSGTLVRVYDLLALILSSV